MLQIEKLSFGYTKKAQVLFEISASIRPGITFLIGENGSGKTTLIKLLASILPSESAISFDGLPCGTQKYKSELAYLPQSFDIYSALKVKQILSFVAGLRGVEKRTVMSSVESAAKSSNITDFLEKRFKDCSGGIQRRVGIACTLIGTPNLILLDEPTVGIDPKERIQLYHTLKTCFVDKTVIISTHILDDLDLLANHIMMLHNGRLSFHGTYKDFCGDLEGKVYLTDCPYSEISNDPHIVVLSKSDDSDLSGFYRVFSDDQLPAPKFKMVKPTSEDIWIYHQSKAGEK